ncbi:DNA repair protein RecO [Candidatus Peregrinibacteria bacterium]|nr:DNA repair protein RecO [Candidatus Peregrinibacteria bacterium]
MRYRNIKGMILRKQNRNESDYYLTIFSPEMGLFNAISKSSRKITSQKGSHLDTLNILNLQIYQLNTTNIVTQCECLNSFFALKENFTKTIYAQTAIEIFQKSIAGNEDSEKLFELLENTLKKFQNFENAELILEEFKIKLLLLIGILPEIKYCFYTGKKWQESDQIYIDNQGHLSSEESITLTEGQLEKIPFKIIKLINFIIEGNQISPKLIIDKEEIITLKKITNIFLRNYLFLEIKSEQLYL